MRAPLRSGPLREAPGGTGEGLHTVLTFFETALECAAPSTGTPEGVVLGMTEKNWLKPGDEVIVEVEGLGKCANRMV